MPGGVEEGPLQAVSCSMRNLPVQAPPPVGEVNTSSPMLPFGVRTKSGQLLLAEPYQQSTVGLTGQAGHARDL